MQILLLYLILESYADGNLGRNLAFNKPAVQSSEYIYSSLFPAFRAVDGNRGGNHMTDHCSQTKIEPDWHWWMVDLMAIHRITSIHIYNRNSDEPGIRDRLQNFTVEVSSEDPRMFTGFPKNTHQADVCLRHVVPLPLGGPHKFDCQKPSYGRFVRIVKKSDMGSPLELCEIEVYETLTTVKPSTTSTTTTATAARTTTEEVAKDWTTSSRLPEDVNMTIYNDWMKWEGWIEEAHRLRREGKQCF